MPRKKKHSRLKRRVTVFALGVIAALLLLEVGLRHLGTQVDQDSPFRLTGSKDKDPYTILCLGDSFTFGLGAPSGQSYPDQLQKLIAAQYPRRRIQVLNGGAIARNTTELLQRTREHVKNIDPDLLILLAGDANSWNFYGYHAFSKGRGITSSLSDLINRVRVVRLARRLYGDLESRSRFKSSQERTAKVSRVLKQLIAEAPWKNAGAAGAKERREVQRIRAAHPDIPREIDNYFALYEFYHKANRRKEAEKYLGLAAERYPTIAVYLVLAHLVHQRDIRHALPGLLKEGLRRHDPSVKVSHSIYAEYAHLLTEMKLYNEGIRFFRQSARHYPQLEEFARGLEQQKALGAEPWRRRVLAWIRADLEEIISLCQANGIQVMLHDYPPSVNSHAEISRVFRDLARKRSLPFVSNIPEFERQMRESPGERYFVEDGHCSAKGYGIIAKNLFHRIQRDGILEAAAKH